MTLPSIFIDANILLGFWSLKDRRIPSDLLQPLVELRGHILLTQQVADEVQRNKLSVFLDSAKASTSSFPELPHHLLRAKAHGTLNTDIRAANQSAKSLLPRYNAAAAELAEEIATNRDLATEMLKPLLAMAVGPTDAQLAAARERRERGNPPGKKSDPLGDQISWEQFLDCAKGQKSVWIVCKDGDLAEPIGGARRLLNPLLQAELSTRDVRDVEVFDNLAAALKAFRAAGLHVPEELGDAKLEELEREEEEASYPNAPYVLWPDRPWKCPRCNKTNTNKGLSAHPSQYGGWSYWATCSHCGYRFDTGEAYDD